MQIVDLSLPLNANVSEPVPVEMKRFSHAEGGDMLAAPAGLDRKIFPEELGLSLEIVTAASHAATHIDAPLHYGPVCEGKPAKSIDELPLEWFFGDGVVLDCRADEIERPITAEELADRAATIGTEIGPNQIVLIYTGADLLWGSPKYFTDFRGMTREATIWLLDRGVKVIGIDTFGFDSPFHAMLAAYQSSGSQGSLWPCHVLGREREYCQIERLANLHELPSVGFKVACFPVKISGAGAAWSRVVAIL